MRLDDRACMTQVRMGETVEDLMSAMKLPDPATLDTTLKDKLSVLQADFDRLDAL